MERHIRQFLNRLSLLIAAVATVALLRLYVHHSTCTPSHTLSLTHSAGPHHVLHWTHHRTLNSTTPTPFPSSSCDPSLNSSRPLLSHDKRFRKLISTVAFKKRSHSFSLLFDSLRSLGILSNSSRVLCVAAGAGHAPFALLRSGVDDVTAVDLVEFPPLVQRADPHNLPFFDGIFDLGFSAELDSALFPARFVEEMERKVRAGGSTAVVVELDGSKDEAEGIKALFRRSSVVEVRNVTLAGSEMSLIVMRNNGNPP